MLMEKIKNALKELPMIFVNEPVLGKQEKALLAECIDTGWISSEGPFVREFEEKMAKRVGRKHGIAVCNGSAALDVSVAALKIGKGDEIILPSFTIISCAAAIIRSGASPVLVDSDPYTWNMDVNQIEEKITPRTKAIMVVHIYGLPVDMDTVFSLAKKYGLRIIEDAAQMHGQTYNGRACGSFGSISTFSFYPNKHITTGEGGMLLTDDDVLADRCRSLRNLCFQSGKRFVHEELGWNYRMTNMQAALGIAQLEQLDEAVTKKRNMGRYYTSLLQDIDCLTLPLPKTPYAENIYWVYGILLKDTSKLDVAGVTQLLRQKGIDTRPFFWPMHQQPVFKKMKLFNKQTFSVAQMLATRGFYIPSGLGLTKQQQDQVADVLREVLT
jgi:perosamine synthetase